MIRPSLASASPSSTPRFVLGLFAIVALWIAFGLGSARADGAKAGTWQDATYSGSKGGWRIVEEDGKRFFELTESFEVKRGPDLKLFLSPRPVNELGDKNATAGAIRIGKLTTHRGRARFSLPEDLDLGRFRSIAIHCEKYSVLFAKSSL